jgi:hypothetical protein
METPEAIAAPDIARAVQQFWLARLAAAQKQAGTGTVDQGERGGVTGGKNLAGFATIIADVIRHYGPAGVEVWGGTREIALPGHFRPSKLWDVVATHENEVLVAVELKSHVGPSFGNNFNNRTEEAIGNSHDFWAAYEEGALGFGPRPFLGWLILVEDAPGSRRPVSAPKVPPGSLLPKEFIDASYLTRYERFCDRLVARGLYSHAAIVTSARDMGLDGTYGEMSASTSVGAFLAGLQAHLVALGVTDPQS